MTPPLPDYPAEAVAIARRYVEDCENTGDNSKLGAAVAALLSYVKELEERIRWRPVTTEQEDGRPIAGLVSMRFCHYKKDHQRRTGQKGRWQEATDFGWKNCDRPKLFLPHPSIPAPPESKE